MVAVWLVGTTVFCIFNSFPTDDAIGHEFMSPIMKRKQASLCVDFTGTLYRGRWCESKQPDKSTNRYNPSPT